MKNAVHTRLFPALLCLLLLSQLLLPGAGAAADPMEAVLGTYEGYYYAAQGQTGVTLTVYQEEGQTKAIFEFYNLPDRTNSKEGSFHMDVTYQGEGQYFFDAGDWIDQPAGYLTVDVAAGLSGWALSGTVSVSGSNRFYAEKANSAYEDVQNAIFNDHRYQLLDEGMTWPQAKAYAEKQGGYLAVITSPQEQAFVEGLIAKGQKNQYWLGGYRTGSKSFAWVTGESFSFTNWDRIEPNDYRGQEDYVEIFRLKNPAVSSSQAGKWNDISVDNTIRGEENFFSLDKVGLVMEFDTVGSASDWAGPELQEAYQAGLIPDVLVGKDMTKTITRGEFAAVAVKLYEALSGNRMIIAMDPPFTDIDTCAERLYILKAYNYDIVNGVAPDKYAPNDLLTREQMATMLTRVYQKFQWPAYTIAGQSSYPLDYTGTKKFADDALISPYAYPSVYFMAKHGIVGGMANNCFGPRNTTSAQAASHYANATRQQALLISTRTLSTFG